jgi:hypothetical protein
LKAWLAQLWYVDLSNLQMWTLPQWAELRSSVDPLPIVTIVRYVSHTWGNDRGLHSRDLFFLLRACVRKVEESLSLLR